MKTRDKFIGLVAGVCVLASIAMMGGYFAATNFPSTVPPLSVNEIRAMRIAPERPLEAQVETHAPRRPEASQQSPDERDLRLVRRPTGEELRKRFPGSDAERWNDRSFRVARAAATALYRVAPYSEVRLVPSRIGLTALHAGDYETARTYLRAAVREGYVESLRIDICGLLAWLEDDLDVATALIEESLSFADSRSLEPGGRAYLALNALELATVTGSEGNAERCFARFEGEWDAFTTLLGADFLEASTWLARRGDTERMGQQ